MKLFRRNKQTVNMPPEVAEYYQAERRDRRGATWLLTLLALCVTVAIIIGLFLAGRWIYRTVRGTDDDNKTATTQTTSTGTSNTNNTRDSESDRQSTDTSRADDSSTSTNGRDDVDDTANDDSTTDRDLSDATDGSSSSDDRDGDINGDGASTDRSSTTDDSTSSGQSDSLANTGPGESALLVFVSVSFLGYLASRQQLARTER
ncbi:hypothetical protein E6P97_03315 [Patescibacteria group bacterium]|nr:MAG: hypothetical protein E6P97_03315 [Patescibacteria group bacterium]